MPAAPGSGGRTSAPIGALVEPGHTSAPNLPGAAGRTGLARP